MLLTSLQGYVKASGMVQLMLMPSDKEGEIKVAITARKPEKGEAALFPPLVFIGSASELDAELPEKIKDFMDKREAISTDLNASLEQIKSAAEERKKQEAEKNKPAPKVGKGKTGEAKTETPVDAKKPETSADANMSLFGALSETPADTPAAPVTQVEVVSETAQAGSDEIGSESEKVGG